MKFLLLVIDLIMYTICIHTYLISLPLPYLNFPHLSFLMQVWVFVFNNLVICGPRVIVNFCKVGGKLAISTIFLVDLDPHFVRNMLSCSWSSDHFSLECNVLSLSLFLPPSISISIFLSRSITLFPISLSSSPYLPRTLFISASISFIFSFLLSDPYTFQTRSQE